MMWPTYSNGVLMQPGQWIKGFVPSAGVTHHGIIRRIVRTYFGFEIEVIHNAKQRGVVVTSLQEFGAATIQLVRQPATPEHANFILATADANYQKPYSLIFQNCEHFCSLCYTGEASSGSVKGFVALAALAGVAVIAATAGSQSR